MGEPAKSGIVSAIGGLNVLFGFTCGCAGLVFAVALFAVPALIGMGETAVQQTLAGARTRLTQVQTQAQADLVAARASGVQQDIDDAQLATVQARKALDALNKQNPAAMFQTVRALIDSPGMAAYNYINAAAMFVMNLLWIITGFALVRRRSWARSLAMGTAGFKIAVELALGVIAVVVMPDVMQEYMQSMQEALANIPMPGGQTQQFKNIGNMGVQTAVQAVIGALIFMTYPVIVLVVLRRPAVRQEFAEWRDYDLAREGIPPR